MISDRDRRRLDALHKLVDRPGTPQEGELAAARIREIMEKYLVGAEQPQPQGEPFFRRPWQDLNRASTADPDFTQRFPDIDQLMREFMDKHYRRAREKMARDNAEAKQARDEHNRRANEFNHKQKSDETKLKAQCPCGAIYAAGLACKQTSKHVVIYDQIWQEFSSGGQAMADVGQAYPIRVFIVGRPLIIDDWNQVVIKLSTGSIVNFAAYNCGWRLHRH